MGRKTSSAATPVRAGFLILFGGLSLVTLGCNPQALSMLMMSFSDNKVPPQYKLFEDKKKEVKLVILAKFDQPEFRDEVRPTEVELPECLKELFRQRCAENKLKIKIVSQADVRNYRLKQTDSDEIQDPVAVGKYFKADYVLDLHIESLVLYAPKTHPPMYRGTTEILVNLYKMDVKDDEYKVFSDPFRAEYPGNSGPIDASSMNVARFRGGFLNKVARDMTRLFIPFDPDERHRLD